MHYLTSYENSLLPVISLWYKKYHPQVLRAMHKGGACAKLKHGRCSSSALYTLT